MRSQEENKVCWVDILYLLQDFTYELRNINSVFGYKVGFLPRGRGRGAPFQDKKTMNNFDHSISAVFIHYIALGFIVMPDAEARPKFLEDIIRFYGQNDTFSVESLENILGLMKKGRGIYDLKDDQNSLVNSKVCEVFISLKVAHTFTRQINSRQPVGFNSVF